MTTEISAEQAPIWNRFPPIYEALQIKFTGLSVSVGQYMGNLLTINGERVIFRNGECTKVHFEPRDRQRLVPSQMTDSLAKGIQGVTQLIEAIDSGEIAVSSVFVGTTNINMALIAQRLGFVIVDECKKPNGEIDRDLNAFTIVGKLEDMRSQVEKLKIADVEQKLTQRNQRLRTT